MNGALCLFYTLYAVRYTIFCRLLSFVYRLYSTLVENPLQISPFMQNKPNFRKSQMNVSSYNTIDYEKYIPLAGQKNKPKTNPIKPNSRKAKMNVNLTFTKDYRKKDDFSVRINKPNFQNAKNERKRFFAKGL